MDDSSKKENMELIQTYFPELSEKQKKQLIALGPLYREWNEKINVISRKDIDHLYEHHVLHSLALAKYNPFESGMNVLDAGTGGGFPGIPLAILYPEVMFTLLDATAKKILVAKEVAAHIGLENVNGVHARLEEHRGEYDLVTSRAVSTLPQMVAWTGHLVPSQKWIFLKGGDPAEIRKELPPRYGVVCTPVNKYFREEYFAGKYIVDVKKA
jgi:16S rRNA (guanine527-N7)-methyltransferase